MILPEGNPFGQIRGLIRCTPEEALRDFNFVMSPSAEGVIFRGYTYLNANGKKIKGTFASNYIPPSNPQTIPQQAKRGIFAHAILHWQLLDESEKDEYRRRARQLKMSGYNLHNKEYLNSH
jgi:hypothetical protein